MSRSEIPGALEGPGVEHYHEYRLTGQPEDGFPFYNHTFRDEERVRSLRRIWTKIQDGEYDWTGARLQTRGVTVITTAWVDEEGGDDQEGKTVREEAVSVSVGGEGGAVPDAVAPAGVHTIPVREASEADMAPEQEAARVNAGHCGHCGGPGIQGQSFSGGREYYCPRCDDVHTYPWAQPPPEAPWVTQLREKDAEIARLRSEAKRARYRLYNAWSSMRIPGGTPYTDGIAAARAILLDAMNSLGWNVVDPDVKKTTARTGDNWCEYCHADMGDERTHYHCSKCHRRTGMMGHDVCPT